jgi:hypothetical protein
MYIVYISVIVYYCNTIDGNLTNVIPRMNGSNITISMAIGKTHISILKIDCVS